jgi:hypothetical protein
MGRENGKVAKARRIKQKSPAVHYVTGTKKPTAAQITHWDARLKRMGCSAYAGTHPRWLDYEHELSDGLFLAADAEYAYPASKHRTGPKAQSGHR